MDASGKYVRCILFPHHIANNALAVEAFLGLQPLDKQKKSYGFSLGAMEKLRELQLAYEFCCKVANVSNDKKRKKKGADFDESKRTTCLGLYLFDPDELKVSDLVYHKFAIDEVVEFGLNEHCNLRLNQIELEDPPPGAKALRANERTRFVVEYTALLHGPSRHICKEDQDRADELMSIRLPNIGEAINWDA